MPWVRGTMPWQTQTGRVAGRPVRPCRKNRKKQGKQNPPEPRADAGKGMRRGRAGGRRERIPPPAPSDWLPPCRPFPCPPNREAGLNRVAIGERFRFGEFLPLAVRRVLPGGTAAAVSALRLAVGSCAWPVVIGKGKGEGAEHLERPLLFSLGSSRCLPPHWLRRWPGGISDWTAQAVARLARRRGAELTRPMSRLCGSVSAQRPSRRRSPARPRPAVASDHPEEPPLPASPRPFPPQRHGLGIRVSAGRLPA